MDCLQIKDVSYKLAMYGDHEKTIIDRVNVTFKANRMVLITGATGEGKSTFLHIIAGLTRPTEGEIQVDNNKVSRWISYHRDMWRRNLGIIFQQPHLLNGLTVLENVCLPLIPRKTPLKEIQKKGYQALERVSLAHLAGNMVMSLSGGERQRIAIARAFVSEPEMILADEPTAHQDTDNVCKLMRTFANYIKPDRLIIVATHDPRLTTSQWFDDFFRIEKGKLERTENSCKQGLIS